MAMTAEDRIRFAEVVQTDKGNAILIDGYVLLVVSPMPKEEQDAIVMALVVAARKAYSEVQLEQTEDGRIRNHPMMGAMLGGRS